VQLDFERVRIWWNCGAGVLRAGFGREWLSLTTARGSSQAVMVVFGTRGGSLSRAGPRGRSALGA
jgi:hypothetical protein